MRSKRGGKERFEEEGKRLEVREEEEEEEEEVT